MTIRSLPYFQLSSFYFFYFAFFGTLLPYAGLYYQSLGFNAVEIGQLLAVFVGTKIIAPNVFGWIADRSGLKIFWVRICSLLALLAGAGLVVFDSFWPILWSVFAFSFFFHAALPQFESFTFSSLKTDKADYGRIRLWGSVGFIFAVMLIGWALECFSVAWLPWILVAFLALILLTSFWVKDGEKETHQSQELSLWHIVKQPRVMGLLWISLLINLSHGAYYSFYSIHLTQAGFESSSIAWLWTVGVIAEIVIFIWMARIFKAYSIAFLIILTLVLTLIRWLLIPLFVEVYWVLFIAQLLHAFSYGLFHAAAISLTDRYFQGRYQGQGQALYAAVSNGLGGALGMLMAGYAWFYGGAIWAFGMSAFFVAVALLISFRVCRPESISN